MRRRDAPAFAALFADVDPAAITSRDALARLPVTRKSELLELQKAARPFGGLAATRWGAARRVFASPGPDLRAGRRAPDYWRLARALFAAGFRRGDLVHNCFAYHFTPAGSMLETGAHALGCTVFPGGTGQTEQQVQAMAELQAGRLRRHAVVPQDHSRQGRRARREAAVADQGARVRRRRSRRACATRSRRAASQGYQAYATRGPRIHRLRDARRAKASSSTKACWSRSCGRAPAIRCAPGEVGEVVVTTLFNADYPLIRFGTGDLSALLPGASPCGRTNMRIKGWMGRADQTHQGQGHVRPSVAGRGDRQAASGDREARGSSSTIPDGNDRMTLHVEVAGNASSRAEAIVASIRDVTKLRGEVAFRAPGELPNDGKVIDDLRKYE